jgi:alkyl hydroperoxide reductase subunit AhpC
VIGPDKTIKLILVYPMTSGRSFDEVLRVIDSLQLAANKKVATRPVDAGRRDHRRARSRTTTLRSSFRMAGRRRCRTCGL